MNRFTGSCLVCLTLVGSAGSALAQSRGRFFRPTLNRDIVGKGTLTRPDGTEEALTRAVVTLAKDGTATIRLIGEHPVTFNGRWTGRRADVADLKLTRGMGISGVTGEGQVTMGANHVTQNITMEGDSDEGRFAVRFTRTATMKPPTLQELKTQATGTGQLTISGKKAVELDKVTVDLLRNGNLGLRFSSAGKPYSFTGRWLRGNVGVVNLAVSSGLNGPRTSATGTLSLRGKNQVDRLRLRGTTLGKPLTVSFTAEAESPAR